MFVTYFCKPQKKIMINFPLSQIPERTPKPRKYGLTMVMDKGLSITDAQNFLSVAHPHVDIVKLGFGTSFVTPNLREKIEVYQSYNIPVYFGGTLFEAFLIRNQFEDYISVCKDYKINYMEVSDGSITIPHAEKIAMTYINEKQWENALKPLENAMRIQRNTTEYNLAFGECKMHLGNYKEAIQHLGIVVRQRPSNTKGWQTLIRCLYNAGYYEEAAAQCVAALNATDYKPLFYFLYSAALFALKKSKQALFQLEKGLDKAPKLIKKLIEINPSVLHNYQVINLASRYKKRKKN
jgi:tetratricopeptide (TPR) repeat protein